MPHFGASYDIKMPLFHSLTSAYWINSSSNLLDAELALASAAVLLVDPLKSSAMDSVTEYNLVLISDDHHFY